MSASTGREQPGDFIPEQFCDEVYDYVDDNLAEAMDEMEKELLKAAPKAAEAQGATADQSNSSFEKTVKTCCDNVQKRLQKEFDRNLDIFDRYVKKNVSAATSAAGARREPTGSAAAVTTAGNGGAIGGGAVAEVGAAVAGGGRESTPLSASKPGRGVREGWTFEVEEGSAPKRLEEEEALDADIKRLRKRRREGLRRCAAMVRKSAREATVLQDVNDYVEALQMGVSNSFDDNGLTPVPAKVQEAVQSSAALRVTADRAQELARRLEREATESASAGGAAGSGSSAAAAAAPEHRDLQAVFQRSSEHQVIAGGASEYSALEARLRG